MAKLYLASLKFSPSLWVIISSIGKVFCCQIRDLEIKFNIYKKSVDVLSWWSECYTLKNNNTNNSSIIIITKEGDLPLWNHVHQNKLIFLRKEFLEKLQHEINGLLVNSDFFFHLFLLLLFFPNHSLWFFFFFNLVFLILANLCPLIVEEREVSQAICCWGTLHGSYHLIHP